MPINIGPKGSHTFLFRIILIASMPLVMEMAMRLPIIKPIPTKKSSKSIYFPFLSDPLPCQKCPGRCYCCSYPKTRMRSDCTIPSLEPEAMRWPSGDHAIIRHIISRIPTIGVDLAPSIAFHTCTVPSPEPEAMHLPSGDHATAFT
jgi:hypothetical protein